LHPSRFRIAGIAVGLCAILGTAACGSGGTGPSSTGLAASQVLKFPVFTDPKSWDPGVLDQEVDSEIVQNVYDNLWRFDDKLNIIPDIATDVPSASNGGISADGMTYTVHLKQNVTFSNGDKVTSKDVLYSWNRAAALRGPYRSSLGAIAGYSAVSTAGKAYCAKGADPTACHTAVEQHLAANDPTLQMSGLTAPDPYTVKITLSGGCGWCLAAWTLQASVGSIVDQKVITNDPFSWWLKPGGPGVTDGQVGTGAFYMSNYVAKQSAQFKAVSNWWGSPKPTLTGVDLDIKDPSTTSTSVAAWEQGSYDIIGYGGNATILPIADLLRVQHSSSESSQLLLMPKGRTTWLSFDIGNPATGGPFLGESDAAKGLRLAFALAIDTHKLASTVCHNIQCIAQTGGVITKGLVGYLGDNSDPLAKFNPTKAKALLKQFDPDGSKTSSLKYSYNTGGLNDPVAAFVQAQWQQNLGVSVALDPNSNGTGFIADRLAGKYVIARDGWQFDYNHPQDWFDNLWGSGAAGANTSGFADPTGDPGPDQVLYDTTLAKADAEPIDQALPLYKQLSQLLQKDVAYAPLYYSVGTFLIKSYVKGAGSSAQIDYYWNEASLLSH
jgi:oligopeptide transport system substrate-binding protein